MYIGVSGLCFSTIDYTGAFYNTSKIRVVSFWEPLERNQLSRRKIRVPNYSETHPIDLLDHSTNRNNADEHVLSKDDDARYI